MLAILGNIFGAIGGGAITGLLGSAMTAFVEYKKQKQQFEFELAKTKLDQETMKMEWEGRAKIATTEKEEKVEVAESEAFAKSFAADKATYLKEIPKGRMGKVISFMFAVVDFVRGMTRPTLTFYLCALTTWLAYEVYTLVGGLRVLTPEQAYNLLMQILMVVLYITTSCVLWWFGTRPKVLKKLF